MIIKTDYVPYSYQRIICDMERNYKNMHTKCEAIGCEVAVPNNRKLCKSHLDIYTNMYHQYMNMVYTIDPDMSAHKECFKSHISDPNIHTKQSLFITRTVIKNDTWQILTGVRCSGFKEEMEMLENQFSLTDENNRRILYYSVSLDKKYVVRKILISKHIPSNYNAAQILVLRFMENLFTSPDFYKAYNMYIYIIPKFNMINKGGNNLNISTMPISIDKQGMVSSLNQLDIRVNMLTYTNVQRNLNKLNPTELELVTRALILARINNRIKYNPDDNCPHYYCGKQAVVNAMLGLFTQGYTDENLQELVKFVQNATRYCLPDDLNVTIDIERESVIDSIINMRDKEVCIITSLNNKKIIKLNSIHAAVENIAEYVIISDGDETLDLINFPNDYLNSTIRCKSELYKPLTYPECIDLLSRLVIIN